MKNVIKRGTSLLLVLAMLLSFAAVVGAEEPATPEKILTLTVENAVLHAGETKCLPVYETVKEGHSVDMVTLSAISDNKNVVVKGVYAGIPAEWTGKKWIYKEGENTVLTNPRLEGISSAAAPEDIPLLTWLGNDDSFTTSDLPLCYVQVTATADAAPGAYQINMTKDPNVQEKTLFSIVNPEGGRSITKTADDAILNPGTVIVLPDGVNLPTVIMTDDTFAVPTWEEMKADKDEFALASRLKIIGGDKKLYDVDAESLVVSAAETLPDGVYLNDGKTLELATRAEANTTGISLTVKSAKAVGADISISAPATVTAKISKATPYHLYTGFGKSGGYVPAPTTTQEVTAAEYSDSKAFRPISLNAGYPAAFDQFGKEMDSPKVKLEVMLFSDEECRNPLSPTDDAYQQVTVTENQTGVQVSNQLKKDVWCMVKTYVESTGAKTYGEQAKVHIISQYPQAEKAVIKLTDENNKPFSGNMEKGTFDIPGGSGRTTIKFAVDKFLDKKNNEEMKGEAVPTNYTVAATQTSPATPADDVTISIDSDGKTGTITVGSGAVKSAPVEIEIKVTLADNTELTGILKVGTEELPAKITLKKGNPFATSLASYDSNSYAKGEIRADSYEGNALPTVLPGIGGDEASVVLAPLYVLDQYDAVMQTGVAAANYKLYKVDGETKTLISADYAKFEDGSEGRVTLKLTNALAGEEGAKSLALTAGNYQIEATYNNKTAIARFTMAEATEKTYVATVTAEITTNGYTGDKSVKTLPVPYAHGGTSQQQQTPEITYTATVTDQYGEAPAEGTNVVAKITSIKLGTSQADYINDNSSKFIVPNGTTNAARLQVTKELATVMNLDAADSVVVHVGLTVTVDGKPAKVESVPDYTFTTDEPKLGSLGVYLRTDESVLTALGSWSSNATNNPEALTVVAPAGEGTTRNVLDFAVYDQYRRSNGFAKALTKGWLVKGELPTGMTFGDKSLTAGSIYEVTVTKDAVGKTFTITAPAAKNVAGTDWTVKVMAVAVEFVKTVDGKNDMFQLGDYLTNGTFSTEYNGQPWSTILAKKDGAKVYIKTAEGDNTPIDADNLSLEVTKDGAPVGMDAKANAGTYKVKLVYTDAEGQKYTVDEKTFTISPKTVKITVNGAITKEYDGTQNLVLPAGVTLTLEGNPADLTVDPNALRYESADASTDIQIELVPGETTCLTGDAAINYTADLSELKGTITARQLTVTPNEKTFTYGQDTEINAALASEYTTNINELPTTCVAPTIEGSMVLQKNGEAKTIYNADTYDVANGLRLTGASAGNYEIQFTPGVQWTINRKLLTKVIADKSSSSGFGATAEACITEALKAFVRDEYVSINDTAFVVSDFVNKDDLSFPSSTEYVTGQNGTKYPVPKTYTLTVKDKPKKDIGKNYRVDDTTEYEFNYTVNQLNASDLIVTLTKADGSTYSNENPYIYNGQNQTPTAKVTYEIKQSGTVVDTLDLTSRCKIEVPTQAIDAGSYSIKITSDLLYSTQSPVTVPWKINPKAITADMFTQKSDHPVYDGTEQTLTGSVLDGKDSEITVNGENKVLKLGTDFTAAEVKQTNAGEYTMTVTGQGNYTGTADVKVKIDKYKGRVYTEIDKLRNTTVEVTRGQSVEYEILTDVVLHEQELVATLENEKIGKIGYQIYGDGGNMAGIENPRIEVTGDKKLLFKATVTNQVEVGRKFRITFENSLDNENIKSRLVLTIYFVVTEKPEQENFQIVEGSEGTYSYSQGGLQLTTTGSEKGSTVSWSSSNTEFATVDNTGKVTFVKPTTADVIITATASETSAPNALFKATERTYRLTITKGQVTITASSATMTANDPLPGFSATASGLNPNDSVSEVFQTLTASAATDGKTAGTFRVTPNATFKTGGRKNWSECYDLYFVAGTLTVNPAQTAIDVVLPIIIGGNTCANGYANCACESFYDLDASRWYHEAIDWAYSLGLMNGTTKSTFGPNAAATRAQTWTMLARIAGQDTRRSSTWYEVGQKWAMNLGITDGTNPMGSLTREQLAAMLYRYVGSPAVNGTLTFTDSTNVSTWARNAMIWAVQNGILDGVGGNRLNPKGTTTRAQAAAIFMRFSKLINK